MAARALAGTPVAGADGDTLKLGRTNGATLATVVQNTAALANAVALKGVVATSQPGPSTAGVWGQSNAQRGNGVFGIAMNGAAARGVYGRSLNGMGVYGEATATSGANYGVYGKSLSTSGLGVYGTGRIGVQGKGAFGVFGNGTDTGVVGDGFYGMQGYGTGPYSIGVYGKATGTQSAGIVGDGNERGVAGSGYVGVHGTGVSVGVTGTSGDTGVVGNGGNWGIFGYGGSYAGYFNGDVWVQGQLFVNDQSFRIDHPADPANRTLEHASVEAPERLNVYRGTVMLNGQGAATVRLPRYVRALNGDYSYQLTPLGAPAPSLHVAREITRYSFGIAGGVPGQRVCWQVTGARQDAWARRHPLRVDRAKKPSQRGKYLDPNTFGQPRSAAIHVLPKLPRVRRPRRVPGGLLSGTPGSDESRR
jgi:hypothetical protein